MQFTTATLSAIFTAAATAAAIGKRDTIFSVSDFSAGCIPHSTQCLYSFTVLQAGTMETHGVNCSALVAANTDGTLPNIPQYGGACTDSSRTFWFTKEAAGLKFFVSQPVTPSSNQTGSYLIPDAQLTTTTYALGSIQSYSGPTSLSLS